MIPSEGFLLFSWRQKARIYPKNSVGSNKSRKGKDEGAERGTLIEKFGRWVAL